MKHLWEIDHPYYCNEGNYFNNDCGSKFGSWQDFIDELGDADLDMNLVFRFDWKPPTDDDGEPFKPMPDNGHKLLLFYMGQRKGLYRWREVSVRTSDEPAVLEWLKVRFDHMMKLWEPFALNQTPKDQP